ncbi:hypothetical protein PO909_000856 [Leuciscus waleckii]
MRTLGKAIHVAETQNTPWKQRLNTFLREYRTTPHSTTEASPAELLFKRKIHTKIPLITTTCECNNDHIIREQDTNAKAKMKSYSDARRHAKPTTFTPGDKTYIVTREQLYRINSSHNLAVTPYLFKELRTTFTDVDPECVKGCKTYFETLRRKYSLAQPEKAQKRNTMKNTAKNRQRKRRVKLRNW